MRQVEPSHVPAGDTSRLVLVVEDEILIAMEVEAVLLDGGFRVLGPAASVEEALALLTAQPPDAAVLDVNLRGELVSPVAEILRYRSIPFIVTSAHERPDEVAGSAVAGVPHLGKPTSPLRLVAALRALWG
ncbi:MAG: response regulator receiver protein [Hyphomicrobiales bacterium]|nr:response regulator receiver protein [Hyphomicrobiales bacterium]